MVNGTLTRGKAPSFAFVWVQILGLENPCLLAKPTHQAKTSPVVLVGSTVGFGTQAHIPKRGSHRTCKPGVDGLPWHVAARLWMTKGRFPTKPGRGGLASHKESLGSLYSLYSHNLGFEKESHKKSANEQRVKESSQCSYR